MEITINVISFDIAAKAIGKEKLMLLIRRGIVRYARRSTSSYLSLLELNSLPQRERDKCIIAKDVIAL